jgi:hypothetical protein
MRKQVVGAGSDDRLAGSDRADPIMGRVVLRARRSTQSRLKVQRLDCPWSAGNDGGGLVA